MQPATNAPNQVNTVSDQDTATANRPLNAPPQFDQITVDKSVTYAPKFQWTPDPNMPTEQPPWFKHDIDVKLTGEAKAKPRGSDAFGRAIGHAWIFDDSWSYHTPSLVAQQYAWAGEPEPEEVVDLAPATAPRVLPMDTYPSPGTTDPIALSFDIGVNRSADSGASVHSYDGTCTVSLNVTNTTTIDTVVVDDPGAP